MSKVTALSQRSLHGLVPLETVRLDAVEIQLVYRRCGNGRRYGISLRANKTKRQAKVYGGVPYMAVCYRAYRLLLAYAAKAPMEVESIPNIFNNCLTAVYPTGQGGMSRDAAARLAGLKDVVGSSEYYDILMLTVGEMPRRVHELAMKA